MPRSILLAALLFLAGCATLKRGYEAACLEACRTDGGAAQGTSRCEQGCRSR